MISKPLSRCDPSHPACLRRQHMMLIYGLTIIYGWLTRLMYARRPWGSWPLEILLIKSCIALGMGWNSCFQPKTLLLALFWVNRGDILGNWVFDFDLMHRKSSCLFIISLECFCLWIWNIKMAIVQANELKKKKSMSLLNKILNYVQVLGFTFVEHLEGVTLKK